MMREFIHGAHGRHTADAMDDAGARADRVVVPRGRRVVLVRFPGHAEAWTRVEALLGGRRMLARACFPRESSRRDGASTPERARARVDLRFSACDRGGGRAHGERRETRAIVLRMTTYAVDDGDGGDGDATHVASTVESGKTVTEVEAIGTARWVYVFRGVADFARGGGRGRVGAAASDAAADAWTMKAVKGGANDPFELGEEGDANARAMGGGSLRPSLFTRDDIPVADYFTQRDTGATTTREVDFHEIAVPTRGLDMEEASPEASRAMRALMEEREMWAPLAALARLPKDVADEILARKLHAMCSYSFANGPFKRLWIKVGVDPRFDRAYVRSQTITVRLPSNWFQDDDPEGARRKARFASCSRSDRGYHDAVHGFRSIPDVRHPVLTLADVALPSVRAAVELAAASADHSSACDERRGWLPHGLHRKIQRAIVRGYRALLDGDDPIVADEASMGAPDDAHVDDDASPSPVAAPDSPRADADALAEYEILGDQDDSEDEYE